MTDDGRQAAESIGVHGPSTRNRDARHRGRRRVRRVVYQRSEDLRGWSPEVLRGRKVADGVRMLIAPGSMRVRATEAEGAR